MDSGRDAAALHWPATETTTTINKLIERQKSRHWSKVPTATVGSRRRTRGKGTVAG